MPAKKTTKTTEKNDTTLIVGAQAAVVKTPNGALLNFRKEPSLDAEVIALLKDGQKLTVHAAVMGDWLSVEVKEGKKKLTGYVMNKYVEELKEA